MKYILLLVFLSISFYSSAQIDSSLAVGNYITINGKLDLKQVFFIFVKDYSMVSIAQADKKDRYGLLNIDEIRGVDLNKGIKNVILLFKDGTWAATDTLQIDHIIGYNMIDNYLKLKKQIEFKGYE